LNIITLADLERMSIAQIRRVFKKTDESVDRDLLRPLISEAYVELQTESQIYQKLHTADTVQNRNYYDLPTDLLDELIEEESVMVKTGASTWRRFPDLQKLEWPDFTALFGDFSNPNNSNDLSYWSIGHHNFNTDANAAFRQMILMGPPGTAYTGGLRFHYTPHPGTLLNVYDQTTIKATFTQNDKTVTFDASMSGNVAADQAIGLNADTDSLPTKWYRIASVTDTTNIELDTNFAESGGSAKNFVVSDVSPLENYRPGLIMYAPVDYVIWKYAEMEEETDTATRAMNLWLRKVRKINQRAMRNRGATIHNPVKRSRHPAHHRTH